MLGPMRSAADRTLELLAAQVGRPLSAVETPVAVVDLDRLDANLQGLQAYTDSHGIELWPHTKTHKSPEIGLRQLALGAGGLTVAKTGEAQVFHEAGAPRILVHYPPFGADKWDRLAALAAEGLELTVAVDGFAPAEGLAAALRRRGATARAARRDGRRYAPHGANHGRRRTRARTGALATRGRGGRGHQLLPGPLPRRRRDDPRAHGDVRRAPARGARRFGAAGIRNDRISGGSTPTRALTHETCVNELRSGTYALLDRVEGTSETCALWVEVTVISNAVPGQIVIDAGSKTLTSDPHRDGGNGLIVGLPEADLHTVNEEHGYVGVSGVPELPALGSHLQVIPNHACGCVNLHEGLLAVRDGVVDHVIDVSARGLVR